MFGQMGQQGMQGIQQMNHAHPGGINAVLLDGSVRTFGAQVDLSEPQDWFVENSFSFGVEREMKESGEKGGTEDAANLQSFTKVMLRTDQDSGSDAGAGGQPISFTDAQTQNSGDWFIADSFSFGVEREMNGDNLSWNFSGIEGAASASTEDTEKGLTDAAGADTSAPKASGFIVEFDRPVDPSPLSGGDLADWQSNYGTGGYAAGDNASDLSLSAAVDTGGIPVSLPEYGLFIA